LAPDQLKPLTIETRQRWPIPNEFREERPRVALNASVELFKSLFPDARFRSISATNNCVGLVVTQRRTWAFPEDLHKILADDGFRQLKGPHEAEMGDVVIYRDDRRTICHVGIVVDKNLAIDPVTPGDPLRVLSKWGADGEYIHDMSYVPELYGKPAEFWTDRRRA
jgi:hypothetical protein